MRIRRGTRVTPDHTRKIAKPGGIIKSLERATGKAPSMEDAGAARGAACGAARQHARGVYRWNLALNGLGAGCEEAGAPTELQTLLTNAGFPNGVQKTMPLLPNVYKVDTEEPGPSFKAQCTLSLRVGRPETWNTPPARPRSDAQSRHLAHDAARRDGPNAEGPLPWIERDYTPVSSAKEWEKGQCDLLIKIYPRGAATSWLHREKPTHVWLSKPLKTLSMPSLVPDGTSFRPASILLLLAGTGVVVLPQVLHHRDPMRQLGFASPRRDQLRVPIDLLFSAREDDVLLLPQIAQWCRRVATLKASVSAFSLHQQTHKSRRFRQRR